MNPLPPADQNSLHIYRGNHAELRARLIMFRNARATLRKWSIPQYVRKSSFPAYESQMKLLFEDAELTDVAMGRATRTIADDGEQPSDTLRRPLYDECNFQIYSLIYRSFTPNNSGSVDACGINENDGWSLWRHLVTFNYEITDDNIPPLKRRFYDPIAFRQKPEMSLDIWATEVRLASNILIANGHPISEREKTLSFVKASFVKTYNQHSFYPPEQTLLNN